MSLRAKREKIIWFREQFLAYRNFDANPYPDQNDEQHIQEIRTNLVRAVPVVGGYINSIGEPTHIYYRPPPITGGIAGEVDLLQNLFNPALHNTDQNVLDMLERAIGRYDYYIENQWKKWVNPFHWIGEVIRLPLPSK